MSLRSFLRVFRAPAPLLLGVALACNNPPPITLPEPPQIVLQLAENNTVGRSFKFAVTSAGCDQVQKLEIFDDATLLKQVPFAGNPTPVELAMNEIRYTKGIATTLSLSARVTCSDGRTNVSQAQLATFFPVEEVVTPVANDTQVVPNYFVAEGSGSDVAFIGCSTKGSVSYLYRVKKSDPANAESHEMDFPCDATTLITDRKPARTGLRWLWTRDRGVMALRADFSIAYSSDAPMKNLAVGPDGSALIYDATQITLVSSAGKELWFRDITNAKYLPGLIAGDPLVRTGGTGTGTILLPVKDEGTSSIDVMVAVLDYKTGDLLNTYKMETLTPIQQFWTAFDDTGSVLYLGVQVGNSASVRACALGADKPLCRASTSTRLWINSALPGYLAALVPFANNTRLAVINANQLWVLDVRNLSSDKASQGGIVNKGQLPLAPNGALVARFAQPGPGSSFYLFTSALGTDATPDPYPVEIVATDSAEQGLLYRYQVQGGSLYGALDDAGTLWMRVGRNLVKPLPPTQYRQGI